MLRLPDLAALLTPRIFVSLARKNHGYACVSPLQTSGTNTRFHKRNGGMSWQRCAKQQAERDTRGQGPYWSFAMSKTCMSFKICPTFSRVCASVDGCEQPHTGGCEQPFYSFVTLLYSSGTVRRCTSCITVSTYFSRRRSHSFP